MKILKIVNRPRTQNLGGNLTRNLATTIVTPPHHDFFVLQILNLRQTVIFSTINIFYFDIFIENVNFFWSTKLDFSKSRVRYLS